jgi:hypothetical protein
MLKNALVYVRKTLGHIQKFFVIILFILGTRKTLGDAQGHQEVSKKSLGGIEKTLEKPQEKILFFVFLISHFRKISPKEKCSRNDYEKRNSRLCRYHFHPLNK